MSRKPLPTLIRAPRCVRPGPHLAGPARHLHRRRLRRRSRLAGSLRTGTFPARPDSGQADQYWNTEGDPRRAREPPFCAANKASMASRQRAQTWMICAVGAAGSCKHGRSVAAGRKSPVKSGGSAGAAALRGPVRDRRVRPRPGQHRTPPWAGAERVGAAPALVSRVGHLRQGCQQPGRDGTRQRGTGESARASRRPAARPVSEHDTAGTAPSDDHEVWRPRDHRHVVPHLYHRDPGVSGPACSGHHRPSTQRPCLLPSARRCGRCTPIAFPVVPESVDNGKRERANS
jgi:hypothetical protein